ncbi:MAG: nicotinamide-nucleotide adenylyltransferase [Candidatus Hermodarchaeota archaeon]
MFIGRFQPPHNGHVHALKDVFAQEEQVILVIGSAQACYTPDNPFTAGERIMMLESVLEELEIPCLRFQIIPVPDIHNYRKWVNHVKQYVPPFGIVYTGSETTRQLFSEQKHQVKKIDLRKKEALSGTEIRRRMIRGEDWDSLVPRTVLKLIQRFDGVQRVRSLSF